MTRFNLLLSCLAPCILAPGIAFAEPVVYLCRLDTNRNGAFQPQLVIAHDAAADVVSVNDALIQGVTGGPLPGTVASDNATRIVFTWTLRNVQDGRGQQASLVYRATIFRADGRVDMSMRPLNFDNSFTARGTCTTE
jgi:hypothetical protein